MHTEFKIVSAGGVYGCENTVSAEYPSVFGQGRVFDKIKIVVSDGNEQQNIFAEAKHLSTEYLGEGGACMTYNAIFELENANIISVSLVSDGGTVVNVANLSGATAIGRTEIYARAYVKINGNGIIFAHGAARLFDVLFDGNKAKITAVPSDDIVANYSANAVSAGVVRGENAVAISVDTAEDEGQYMAFFADKQHIFSVKATAQRVDTQWVNAACSTVGPISYGVELYDLVGSALVGNGAVARSVADRVLPEENFPAPFSYTRVKCSEDNTYFALCGEEGITVMKKTEVGYRAVNPFEETLKFAGIKDFCFLGDTLCVLADKLYAIYADTAEIMAEFPLNTAAEKLFVPFNYIAVLAGSEGVSVYTLDENDNIQEETLPIFASHYCYDKVSQTFTAVSDEGIFQYSIIENDVETENLQTYVDTRGIVSVCGRRGKVAVIYQSYIKIYDVRTGVVITKNFIGADSIKADDSATVFTVTSGTVTTIYRLDEDMLEIGSVINSGEVFPFERAIIRSDGKMHSLCGTEVRFELSFVAENMYDVYREVPFFANESIILTFEADV